MRIKKNSSFSSFLRLSSVIGLLPYYSSSYSLPVVGSAMIGNCSGICNAINDDPSLTKTTSILRNGLTFKRAHFQLIDSTQTRCKEVCGDASMSMLKQYFDMETYDHNTLYLLSADRATNSYGRSNRTWHSVEGNFGGTYMLYWPDRLLRLLPYTSQTVGLAVANTIETYGLAAEIKWANDVLINGRKTAGILIDALPVEKGSMLLIGIGLNVNMDEAAAREKFHSTSDEMKIEFTSMRISNEGKMLDLEEVLNRLSVNLGDRLLTLLQGRFAEELHPQIEERLAYRGRRVVYTDENEIMENVVLKGITSDGYAILRDERGSEHVKLTGRIRPALDFF